MTTKLCATTALALPEPQRWTPKFASFATSAGVMANEPDVQGHVEDGRRDEEDRGRHDRRVDVAQDDGPATSTTSKEATEIKKGPIPASAFDVATIAKGYKKVPNPITQMK